MEGSSFSGLLTRVEIGHMRIGSAGKRPHQVTRVPPLCTNEANEQTADGFDADSDCGRGRTEQGHLQKSLNLSGAMSVYLTVCWMFL